jgi:hypothetical protein
MTRKFVELQSFRKVWDDLGLTDDDLFELETKLLVNPRTGVVIKGSGGARKIRFEAQEKGQRGGVRVIYVDVVISETVYLLYAYPKSVKDDLSQKEISNIRKAITILKS